MGGYYHSRADLYELKDATAVWYIQYGAAIDLGWAFHLDADTVLALSIGARARGSTSAVTSTTSRSCSWARASGRARSSSWAACSRSYGSHSPARIKMRPCSCMRSKKPRRSSGVLIIAARARSRSRARWMARTEPSMSPRARRPSA